MRRLSVVLSVLVILLLLGNWEDANAGGWDDVQGGTLFLGFEGGPHPGVRWVAPNQKSDVDIRVTGPIVRVRVEQTFRNPGPGWAEAVYVFPLPESAAVDRMRMQVGERVIEGEIHERQEAKKIYAKARREGRRAGLVEQERPNLFTTSVANIPPGESILVSIEYQHSVARDGEVFSLRYPMTLTPRYIPGKPLLDDSGRAAAQGTGLAADTDVVGDASRITPPWGRSNEVRNPTTLRVHLTPGFAMEQVESQYHLVRMDAPSPDRRSITLPADAHQANSDFVLRWRAMAGSAPQASLFSEVFEGETYGLLMVQPPARDQVAGTMPRDLIFVIDTSGSMGGEPIRQARQSLLWALERLHPDDRFNVIEFNSDTWVLFDDPAPASPENLILGRRFVKGLESRGGTELAKALEAALCVDCTAPGRLRQVVFLTDGAVGNEDQLFNLIRDRLGESRLFTVGIGHAPNSHFMVKAAEYGRGTFSYIAKAGEIQDRMSELFERIAAPLLTDIRLDLPGNGDAEILPGRLPDLYSGEPLVALVKTGKPLVGAKVSGIIQGRPWQRSVDAALNEGQSGIHVLWGRKRIAELMDRRRYAGSQAERLQLRDAVVAESLHHHLVSAFTSLVAVDKTPARPVDRPLAQRNIPNNPPKGTRFGMPATATSAGLQIRAGVLLLCLGLMAIFWRQMLWRQMLWRQMLCRKALCRKALWRKLICRDRHGLLPTP